ncbi:cytochrome c [Mucilaginibacter yixingensis]|uniref:Cytochrome c n=1 Tax=Mucilaginibacter yixingensis TaxID=1295612 RepID=A0A2T5JAR1_9SPHI|nr:c-type cytochrome [Mucilaginibacter yixingensis]PTQ97946.1 cytochrome c [Mucilaginibacter yixingensis]
MKKFTKWLLMLVLVVAVVAGGAVAYVTTALPNVGPPENIKITYTPERIARGKYLANHVTVCADCHSSHDTTRFGLPIDTNRIGVGGMVFNGAVGVPGEIHVPNITPYNLKNWTDGELFRAITCGVKKDGSAIFPIMPWPYYGKMDREDIYSIIAYIRSLKPQEANYPERKLDFPLNVIVHTIPQKAELGKLPAESDTLKYGAYLVNASGCMECHSQDNKGKLLPGLEFAGGRKFGLNGGFVRSANITPDKETGIGAWTKENFLAQFSKYSDPSYQPSTVDPGQFQTVMPWQFYAKMKKSDLEAVYAYLRTIKPVHNEVIKFDSK